MNKQSQLSRPSPARRAQRFGAVMVTAALVAGAMATIGTSSAASAATQGIIPNGTFEDGISGWSAPFGGKLSASTDARTGTQSLAISDRTSFQSGPAATVTGQLQSGESYDLNLALKYVDGPAEQKFNVVLCTESRSQCDVVASATAKTGAWSQISTTFSPSISQYSYLFVETPWNTDVKSFVIDDVSLVSRTEQQGPQEAPAVPGNLLPDGRFVQDFTGWTAPQGGKLALSTDAATGAHSLLVTERRSSQSGPFANVAGKIELGASYRLTGKLKYTAGADAQQFNFTFCPSNFNGCVDNGQSFKKGEWGTFAKEFTAEERHANAAWLFVETPWGSDALQDFAVDDMSLVKIADAPAQPEFTTLAKVQTKPVGDHNPIVGHKFGADPHHLIYKDRLYIYSTDDTQQYEAGAKDANGLPTQNNGYDKITRLNVMSTTDMVNWVDHGTVPVAGEGSPAPWARNSWAPAAIERDGKVYLYFCDNGSGTAAIVGGSPLGPWEDPLKKKIIPDTVSRDYINKGGFPAGMWLFDPEVFIDDDGQGYLYFGGNSQIGTAPNIQGPQNPKSTRVVKLLEDMVTLDGDPVEIDAPGMFEASSMFKRNGKYYYSYSSNFQVKEEPGKYPTTGAIAYMMTDDPMKLTSAEYAGVAFKNQSAFFGAGNGGNNHSDMFNYKGGTYLTYHAQTRGAAWAAALGKPGETKGYRSVHIDKMEFNDDGTIKPVQGTSAGVDQVEAFNPYRTFEAETLAWQLGISTQQTDADSVEFPEHNGAGNMVIADINVGDFTGLSDVEFGTGAKSVSAKVRPLAEGGSIQVRLDNVDGQVVAEIPVDGALGEWTNVQADVTGATGKHDVFFVFSGKAGENAETKLFEIDNWAFEPADEVPGTPDPQVTLSATQAAAGSTITVSATGIAASEVEIGIESEYRALAQATPVAGAFSQQVVIPADLTPGTHHIVLRAGTTEITRTAIAVTAAEDGSAGTPGDTGGATPGGGSGATKPPTSGLSNTGGSDTTTPALALAAFLLLGAGAAMFTRRRMKQRTR